MTGCQPASQKEETIRPVKTMVIAEPETSMTRIFPGKISPANEVNLSFRVSNRLNELPAKKGQYIHKDEIIAALDTRDFDTAIKSIAGRLDEARANLKAMQAGARNEDIRSLEARLEAARVAREEARLQHKRYEKLFSIGAVAKADLDRVKSRKHEAASTVKSLEMELEKALTGARSEDIEAMQARISSLEAGLEEARSALDDAKLKAPFSGYIAARYVDNFELIQAGQPIVKLQNTVRLEVSAGIPEQLMIQKDLIRSIHIRLESYQDHFFPARIKEISHDASGPARTYKLTAIMDNPENIQVFPSMA
ncbi:MAG: HlyD family secretion protein, partial [Desulfonatronovibrio sp.]